LDSVHDRRLRRCATSKPVRALVSDSDALVRGQVTAGTRLLCETGVRVLPVDGAAVLTRGGPDTAGLLYATDPVITRLDDLEFVTGEGACLEAYWNHSPVLVPDLAGGAATERWPWYAPEAAAIGAGAVFAFPIQVGGMVFGVFWLYRHARGALTGPDLNAARGFARTAAGVVLNDIADHSREQLDAHLADSVFGRVETNRALGVIAEQAHTDIGQARVLLRSTAYAQNRTSRAVAQDVLKHRLAFPPETP